MGHFRKKISSFWLRKKTTDNQCKTARFFFFFTNWKNILCLKMQSPKTLQKSSQTWTEQETRTWKHKRKHDCCRLWHNKRCCKTFSDVSIYFEVHIQSFWCQCKVIMELADTATLGPTLSLSHRCRGWVFCGVRVVKSSLRGSLRAGWEAL